MPDILEGKNENDNAQDPEEKKTNIEDKEEEDNLRKWIYWIGYFKILRDYKKYTILINCSRK